MSGESPVMSLRGVRKEFGAVVALEGVDLDLYAGEIVALVGDNGAGKSTLVKIIAGVHPATSGELTIDGNPVDFGGPLDARRHGIEVVYQDLALADLQPVYMNMFLGRELVSKPFGWLDRRGMEQRAQRMLDDLDVRIPSARAAIRDLSGGQRQAVAIARASQWAHNLVLMDEPTAALGVQETARVEELVLGLRGRGLATLIVSHSLDQVFRLADRICVLRRGRQVGVRRANETDGDEIVAMITGLR